MKKYNLHTMVFPLVYDTAMFEFEVHDWASLAIKAQLCPGVTKAKTAAAMFSGHKWMRLCATT